MCGEKTFPGACCFVSLGEGRKIYVSLIMCAYVGVNDVLPSGAVSFRWEREMFRFFDVFTWREHVSPSV